MRINLNSIDREQFIFKERIIADDLCFLVFPRGVPTWTKQNLHFRSSIWNKDGKLVSAGFKKFMNYGESPDLYPHPYKYNDYHFLDKIDGSCLIISRYKDTLIHRTRGVFDAREHENGFELDILKKKYPKVFDINNYDEKTTYLFEWVSDTQKIVVSYKDCPDIYLIGAVFHEDYSYASQSTLDNYAYFLSVKRPKYYNFNSLQEAIEAIQALKDAEGTCLYYNNDQNIVKLKGEWYLNLFRLKSELSSIEKIIDLFISLDYPHYNDFYKYVVDNLDFEIAEQVRGSLSRVCDAYKEILNIRQNMLEFVSPLRILPRKAAAEKIIGAYGQTNRSGMCFKLLDNKELDSKDIKKLIYQVL